MKITKMEFQILQFISNRSLSTSEIAEGIERENTYVSFYICQMRKKGLIEKDTEVLYGVRFRVTDLAKAHLTQRNEILSCGCEVKLKRDKLRCSKCGHLACPKHTYSRVDGNNRSITMNAHLFCINCIQKGK